MGEFLNNYGIYENMYNKLLEKRIVYINQEIDESIVDMVTMYIITKNMDEENIIQDELKPITIFLNTDGGDLITGIHLIEIIQNSRIPIHVRVLSKACSAGLLIAIAGKRRSASKNSIFLMHDGSYMLANSSSKAKDTMEFLDALEAKVDELIIGKTNLTKEEYEQLKRKELYCFGEEALKYGFIDELV